MRKSPFIEAKISNTVPEQEAIFPMSDLYRKHGPSLATFDKLKAEYGWMALSDAKRLAQIEHENATQKRLVASVMLENVAPKDLLGKP
jgi:hypothetical protein